MLKIAIVGATGLVGQTLVSILNAEKVRAKYIIFGGTPGKVVQLGGKKYISQELTHARIKKFRADFTFNCAEADIAREWAPVFAEYGSIVIDNSSAFRRDPSVPLIIPECNAERMTNNVGRIISNPNCTTIGALVALKPLDDAFKLKRVVYSSYQAISGAGANPKFAYPIENNLIPFIGGEEDKMVFETNKILRGINMTSLADVMSPAIIAVSATCVRVPVKNCHSISINAEFVCPVDLDKVKELLRAAPGLVFVDEPDLPMPVKVDGKDEVLVGRLRLDPSNPNTLNLFTVSDNIRKGAALNAYQIFKHIVGNAQ